MSAFLDGWFKKKKKKTDSDNKDLKIILWKAHFLNILAGSTIHFAVKIVFCPNPGTQK